MTTGKITRF